MSTATLFDFHSYDGRVWLPVKLYGQAKGAWIVDRIIMEWSGRAEWLDDDHALLIGAGFDGRFAFDVEGGENSPKARLNMQFGGQVGNPILIRDLVYSEIILVPRLSTARDVPFGTILTITEQIGRCLTSMSQNTAKPRGSVQPDTR